MSFSDWINSSYPNPSVDGQWGLLHILTIVFCVGIIVAIALIFRKKSLKTRKIILWILVGLSLDSPIEKLYVLSELFIIHLQCKNQALSYKMCITL